MALTNNQKNTVNGHPNIQWLKDNHTRLNPSAIKAKLAEAIRMRLGPASATDSNIQDIADNNGIHYGRHVSPVYLQELSGQVVAGAVSEVQGHDVAMANTLRMIFNRTANGRTAPGTTGVNHIHVGGNAQLNILFDATTYVVYGIVNGHMDAKMSSSIRNQADRVLARRNQLSLVEMRVVGSHVSRV
ncbi:MAG: hypothetical protein AAGC65_24130 [Mucilaginibacter sp.]|uniref:hypothetical protein n=1 Tax=Mucilaginibacter sp. TaxID=1882438 RepID=UPI00319F662F